MLKIASQQMEKNNKLTTKIKRKLKKQLSSMMLQGV